jgi:hypothetical protein
MVGFDPEAKKKLSKGEYGIAGAVSGTLTRFLCQPLDVIKIRFQVGPKFAKSHVYSGRLGSFNT